MSLAPRDSLTRGKKSLDSAPSLMYFDNGTNTCTVVEERRKTMRRSILPTLACLLSALICVEANALTFKKSQVAKSGKTSCAVYK